MAAPSTMHTLQTRASHAQCALHARVTDHFFFLSSINCCTNATGTVRAGPPIVATHSHRPPVPLQHFASPVATADTSCSSQRATCVPQLCLMQALQVCTKNLHTGFARDRLRDSYSHKQILPTHGSSLPVAAVPSAKNSQQNLKHSPPKQKPHALARSPAPLNTFHPCSAEAGTRQRKHNPQVGYIH